MVLAGGLQTNGFVERFNGTVLEEFFRPVMHARLFTSVEALQAELDAWLHHYNRERLNRAGFAGGWWFESYAAIGLLSRAL